VSFFKKIGILVPLILLLSFCRKPNIASWDVDIVLPVVTSQLNIKNFLGDSIFKSDNTGLLNLSVTRTITAIKLDSLIKLPDTTIKNSFITVFPGLINPGQAIPIPVPQAELTFSISNGVALKRTDLRSGSLTVKFINEVNQPLKILFVIPSAVKNGKPFTIREIVPLADVTMTPAVNGTLTKTYDFSGFSLNMMGLNGTTYNTIVQTYTIAVDSNAAGPANVPFGKGATMELNYANVVPDYVEGYFGQQTVAIPLDTTQLELIKNFQASNFMLSSATLDFKILNEFGAEFSANLSNIKSINGTSVVALGTTQLSNINLNRASKVGTTVYPSVKTISLTNNNSNIVPFLSNLPNKVTFQGSIGVNPLGNISGYNDFAFYNTGIKVLADINIPFKFNANYFKLVSNTKVDFANVTSLDKVNSGKFIISANNGYPFSTRLQAYLLDEQGQKIDSLFVINSNVLQPGRVDAQNVVVEAIKSSIEMSIDKSKIQNLKKSKLIRIETYFIMPPNPPDIKIYENYSFDVNIVAELNYNVERK
jgi:hypothetical protein